MAEEIATAAADQPGPGGGRLIDDPAFARKLADARIRTEVLEILEYRVLAAVAEGKNPGVGVVDAQDPRHRTEPGAHRARDGGGRTARAGLPTARHLPRRADRRVRAAAGRLRQRRASGRRWRRCATSTTGPARSTPAATRFSATFSPKRPGTLRGLRMDFNLSKEQELLRDGLNKFLVDPLRPREEPGRRQDRAGLAARHLARLRRRTRHPRCRAARGRRRHRRRTRRTHGHRRGARTRAGRRTLRRHRRRRRRTAAPGGRPGGDASCSRSIVAGTAIVALAAAEAASGDRWQDVSTTAERDGDGWVLTARRSWRSSAPLATHLLVTARTAERDLAVPHRVRARAGVRASTSTRIAPSTTVARPTSSSTTCGCPPTRCSARRAGPGRRSPRHATRAPRRSAPRRSAACGRCWPTPSNTASSGSSSGSRSAASRRCSTAWSTCTWSSSSPSPRSTSPSSTSTPSRRAGPGGVGGQGHRSGGRPGSSARTPSVARRHGHDRGTGDRPLLQAAHRPPVRVRLHRSPRHPVRGADAAGSPIHISQTIPHHHIKHTSLPLSYSSPA